MDQGRHLVLRDMRTCAKLLIALEIVALSGSGWQPGEAVHILVNDDDNQSWTYDGDVIADENGTFTYEVQLPDYFVANYRATATGESGTATTTFTDTINAENPTSNNNGNGASSLSITKPSTTNTGDFLIAGITVSSTILICPPSGWALVREDASGTTKQAVFYTTAGGNEPSSYVWQFKSGSCGGGGTLASTRAMGGILLYNGVATTSPIDAAASSTGTGSTYTAPSVTTTRTGAQVLRFFGVNAGGIADTNGRRYLQAFPTTTPLLSAAAYDSTQPNLGDTGTRDITGGSGSWVGQTVVLKDAAGIELPAAPTLTSPADNALTNNARPTLTWSAVSGATSYTVNYVAKSGSCDFSSGVTSQSVTTTSFTPGSDLADNTYCWRVKAVDGAGNSSAYSVVRELRIDATAPGVPTLSTPSSNQSLVTTRPNFSWSAVSDPSTPITYKLEYVRMGTVAQNPSCSFSTNVVQQSVVGQTSFQPGASLATGTYCWRVTATDAAGNTGTTSSVRKFFIDDAPPTLVAPADNASTNDATPTLSWSALSDATSYTVDYVAKSGGSCDFSSGVT